MNDSFDPYPTITTAPIALKAQVLKKGKATVEFFQNDQSIGKVFVGTPTAEGTDFVLSVPLSKMNNGRVQFQAKLSGAEILGSSDSIYPSNYIRPTIALP